MIVRCSSCNSAFAVADSKVNNKKFAFSCPKCSAENIIDNKMKKVTVSGQFTEKKSGLVPAGSEVGLSGGFSGQEQKKKESAPAGIFGITEETEQKTEDFDISISDDFHISDDEFETGESIIMDDMETKTGAGKNTSVNGEQVIDDSQLDIDIDDLDFKEDEQGLKGDDEINLDDLSLDIDLEDMGPDTGSPKTDGRKGLPDDFDEEDEKIMLTDDLSLELEEELEKLPDTDEFKPIEDEELVLTEADFGEDIDELSVKKSETEDMDNTINVDLGSLDFDTDKAKGKPVVTKEKPVVAVEKEGKHGVMEGDEEDITLDLDSLDLDLIEEDTINTGEVPDSDDMELVELKENKLALIQGLEDEEDEKITLDLDSLDLDLVEDDTIKGGETPDGMMLDETFGSSDNTGIGGEEDEDITLDLDSLDIPISETEENKDGEVIDEDEKLTLDDAGITFDELTSEEIETVTDLAPEKYDDEEEIHITIDEIDPDFDINSLDDLEEPEREVVKTAASGPVHDKEEISDIDFDVDKDISQLDMEFDKLEKELNGGDGRKVKTGAGKTVLDLKEEKFDLDEADLADLDIASYDEDLPDINLEDFEDETEKEHAGAGIVAAGAGIVAAGTAAKMSDELMDLDDREDYFEKGPADKNYISVKTGAVNFSIDYTLAYSRLGALARLLGLFFIALIPHFVVLFIYSLLSVILGFLNHIIVVFTKKPVEDFHTIQENALRYLLSTYASMIGIVEEFPVFAGRDSIDYSMQFNITYALRYSNLLAALRLSVIGIVLITLPHLMVLSLITAAIPVIYLVGIFSVLITGRWPYFLFDFMTRFYRSVARLMAFIIGLVDTYPPFKFG